MLLRLASQLHIFWIQQPEIPEEAFYLMTDTVPSLATTNQTKPESPTTDRVGPDLQRILLDAVTGILEIADTRQKLDLAVVACALISAPAIFKSPNYRDAPPPNTPRSYHYRA